ncbi:MAG: Rpn family recombination-promoting nuclease/putative transposase, partial [Bifidobacteriaceae bacterium]|jgi:predicted transposase/invertase (TIGR01784 family)|nr:Rpn family recombination-promoting nuclease/putative transposase [Bifidobacteriaceae bacterium]
MIPLEFDRMLKEILGSEKRKEHAISFLSYILKRDKSEFKGIQFPKTELSIQRANQKRPLLDVVLALPDQMRVNIEIQVVKQPNIRQRTLYYASRLYGDQLNKGQNYDQLRQTISINILDFILYDDEYPMHDSFVSDPVLGTVHSNDLRLITLELPKRNNRVNIKERQLSREARSWLGIIGAKDKEEFMANATFADTRKVWDDVEELSSSEDMIFAYAREHYANLNYNDDLRWAREEGLQQKQLDIARAMNAEGMDPATIQRFTGLTPDQLT